jgi:hypothetical protein
MTDPKIDNSITGVHIVFPGSKNTQRLGSHAIIAKLASTTRASDAQYLSAKYRELLSSPFTVPPNEADQVFAYLSKRNLLRKYYPVKKGSLNVEVQDWLLSDPSLPSGTGAEREDTRPAVFVSGQLGVLWSQNWQRTWLGDLLVNFRQDIVQAVERGNRQENPFKLNDSQSMLFAWACLMRDLTFMSYLVGEILHLEQPIQVPAFIEQVRSSLPEFCNWVSKHAANPDERAVAKQLTDFADRLLREPVGRKARSGGVTVQTLRRGFEELLLWRLEALVDLGYLKKKDPLVYEYIVTSALIELNTLIADRTQERLKADFFHHWRRISSNIGVSKEPTDEEIARILFKVNRLRANKMGYTLIEEAVILANAILLEENSENVLEFNSVMQVFRSGSLSKYKVLTSVDKYRRLSAFKMMEGK